MRRGRRGGGQVGVAHPNSAREAGAATARVERRVDDLEAPARADDRRRDVHATERDAAEEVDRQPRDDEVVAGLRRLDRAGEQRRRRAAVHHPLVPRPARDRRGDEAVAVGFEQGRNARIHHPHATQAAPRDGAAKAVVCD